MPSSLLPTNYLLTDPLREALVPKTGPGAIAIHSPERRPNPDVDPREASNRELANSENAAAPDHVNA